MFLHMHLLESAYKTAALVVSGKKIQSHYRLLSRSFNPVSYVKVALLSIHASGGYSICAHIFIDLFAK